jgi:hypothetical protein
MEFFARNLGERLLNSGTRIVLEAGKHRPMDADDQKLLKEIGELEQFVRLHGVVTTLPTRSTIATDERDNFVRDVSPE